jgi:septation ring formation regulator
MRKNMALQVLLSQEMRVWIAILCFVGVLLLVLFFVLIDKFVLARKRAMKLLKNLEKKHEYYHALLTGQDAQYIQRLEIISRTNLLYTDIYSTYFKRHKEIRETLDESYQEILAELATYIEDNKIKEFKEYYRSHLNTLKEYESSVNSLNADLVNIIKPEEDCRQASLSLKEKYRAVKSKFNTNETNLQFVYDSFLKVFSAIDGKFNDFENSVENADYDDARSILPTIEKVLDELDKLIDDLPPVIDELVNQLPSKIDELTNRYKTLNYQGYPLNYLNFEDRMEDMNYRLDKDKDLLKALSVNGVKDSLAQMSEEIASIGVKFDLEIESKKKFDSKVEEVSNNFMNLEREFIKLSSNMPKLKKIYLIDENHAKALQDIKDSLENVSKDKRRLESYVHSTERTPYSILINKTDDLEKGTNETIQKFEQFKTYILTLKTDSEQSFTNIRVRYDQLKEDEAALRVLNTDKLYSDKKKTIDRCYALIDQISSLLKEVPIDVANIDVANTELNEKMNTLNSEIAEIVKFKLQTTNNILLMNRDRMKFADINSLMLQAETLYNSGDYRKSYEMSEQIMDKLKSKSGII